ncbi:transcription factor E2F5-like [Syngnathus typhle]|uniref:transcription factor E2F5-like n=1 Tax=Syngnathus typhle TaxID=161592 RepID=UPI002A6A434D|nr:transcription factor E2F5-like [Syngnathus typhle]
MDSERTRAARTMPTRHEKSLGLLTMKFVALLKETRDGVFDLRKAAEILAVKQKRRVYDITNVLEGVGLIEKITQNIIQWRGETKGSQNQEELEQVRHLQAQISELDAQEKELDKQKTWLLENNVRLNRSPDTNNYYFVTHEDICNSFRGDTILLIMAPSGTQLEVTLLEKTGRENYQVSLRSKVAPIKVTLINRESDCSTPVVFSLPPDDMTTPNLTPPLCTLSASPHCPPFSTVAPTSCSSNTASSFCSQDSLSSHQQVALLEHNGIPRLTSTRALMGCLDQAVTALEMDLSGPEFHSFLDVSSLLRHNGIAEHMKEDRHEDVHLINELISTDEDVDLIDELISSGMDYSFTLDDTGGVSDLFDMQVLNY